MDNFQKNYIRKFGIEASKNKIDYLITVGTEAKYIASGAIENGMNPENVFCYNSNIQASTKLKNIAKVGDKILLKASNSMKFGEIFDIFINKIKVAIVVGGMSSEHDVSLMSGKSILEKIDKTKYDIKVIYIKKNGNIYEYTGKFEDLMNIKTNNLVLQSSLINAVEDCDVVFPVLHGKYGEDGCVQGVFEMIKKPYVGCGVFSSSACMDKDFTKKLISLAGIKVANGIVVYKEKNEYVCNLEQKKYTKEELCQRVKNDLDYPVFVKPSREGSSFGVTKVSNEKELISALQEAEKYDNKILIEEEIRGRELECAVLGNDDVISSEVGEILPAESFYTYDAKYNNPASQTIIPAKIKDDERKKIKEYAKLAFKAVNGRGLSRVDFFLKKNGEIILNEINTLPGFTKISMYPKLFEEIGIEYSKLIDILIEFAIER